jgi:radical SAM protein with 4Fe4S-binding SPASM domain
LPSSSKKSQFQRIYLEIGNVCNLQCSFCPEVDRAKARLDKESFSALLAQLKPYAEFVCFHVMGEPLAHPEFPLFVQIASELGVPVEITTNGTLLSETHIESLLNPIIRQVNFSLQSYFDNFPTANPEAYLAKIFAFCHRALQERPELYLNFRLWNLAPGEVRDDLNEKLLLRIESEFAVSINRNVDARLIKSKKLLGRLYMHYDTRFRWPDPADPILREQGTCWGTRAHIAVHADGTVVPCCLDKEARIPLGNLRTQKLSEVLESPRYLAMKKGFENGKLVEDLCRRCDYASRFA